MDAASCVGVAPSALLSRSFADDAIARALHFSLCDYSPLVPEQPHHSVATDDVLGACGAAATPAVVFPRATTPLPSPPSVRFRLGPGGGRRAGKRRPRPSKRAPTTYISTDAATFRLMVQQVTGAQIEQKDDACHGLFMPSPPFDVVEQPTWLPADPTACVASYIPRHLPAPAEAAAEKPCFPTLDSWNVMYGKEDEVV
ncbi:hypothetical protein GUJ93_ZPchr0003g18532 [Zizania palustris]|uniref:VQ domain-containing protein n=1 Tax=Zizania palustris TaxID=103762 RepID=A0A8J5VEN6_ZIZPA|nr:hypothetical protein GUJ93_ZPchr0003g18532 [Zizania palustris]